MLLRVTPGIEAHTHEYVKTGQDDSKFGFGMNVGDAARALERAAGSTAIDLVGLHAHIGSQVFAVDSFRAAIEVLAPFVRSAGLPELIVGGGLGVAYVEGEEAATLSQWAKVLHEAAQEHGVPVPIAAEPGRAIVAAAAVTLYTVGTIKELPGLRTYVAVDGGMSDNPRPVLYGSGYEAFLPRSTPAGRPRSVRIVGKHCESGDVLVHNAHVPDDIAVGRPVVHSGHGCLRALDGFELQQGASPRQWCSCETATRKSSSAARRTTTCCATTFDAEPQGGESCQHDHRSFERPRVLCRQTVTSRSAEANHRRTSACREDGVERVRHSLGIGHERAGHVHRPAAVVHDDPRAAGEVRWPASRAEDRWRVRDLMPADRDPVRTTRGAA